MIADTIKLKYLRHLQYLNGSYVSLEAVNLAMSLALEELAESIPSTPSTNVHTPDRQAERDSAQLARLNDWLAEHAPDTYHEPGDTADAVLIVLNYQRTAKDSREEELGSANLRIMELEADLSDLRVQLTRARQDAALDNTAAVINAQLNRRNTELVAQISTLQAEIANLTAYTDAAPNPPPAPLPLDLSSLAPDELQQVAAVQSGEKPWRTLSKPLRIQVASLTLRQLAAAKGERITQREWEAQRPPWMPTSGSLTYMYGQAWEDIPQE